MFSNAQEKKIKLEEEAISEILVAETYSESSAEASDVEDYFEEEEEEEQQQQQQQITASFSRSRTPGCNKWRITNLETASRKEHKYSSFCRSSRRCEKKWGSTHQQRQFATVCVDVVFHRNFSSAGEREQRIL